MRFGRRNTVCWDCFSLSTLFLQDNVDDPKFLPSVTLTLVLKYQVEVFTGKEWNISSCLTWSAPLLFDPHCDSWCANTTTGFVWKWVQQMFVYHRFPWPYIYIIIYIILYCLYNPLLHRPSSLIWMYKGRPACKFQPLQFSGNCTDVVFGERNFLICVEEPFWYPDARYILLLWCSWFTESSSYRCCFHHVVRDMSAATHAQWAGLDVARLQEWQIRADTLQLLSWQ